MQHVLYLPRDERGPRPRLALLRPASRISSFHFVTPALIRRCTSVCTKRSTRVLLCLFMMDVLTTPAMCPLTSTAASDAHSQVDDDVSGITAHRNAFVRHPRPKTCHAGLRVESPRHRGTPTLTALSLVLVHRRRSTSGRLGWIEAMKLCAYKARPDGALQPQSTKLTPVQSRRLPFTITSHLPSISLDKHGSHYDARRLCQGRVRR